MEQFVFQCYKKPKKGTSFERFRVGDYLNDDGRPTLNLQRAASWEDSRMLEDCYTWGTMSDYFRPLKVKIIKKVIL